MSNSMLIEPKAQFVHLKDPTALQEIARKIRISILQMIHRAGSGHTGSSLSCVELLVSLYFSEMHHYPFEPLWPGRDRLVLSKGHAAPALYAVLQRCGYLTQHDLGRLRKLNSHLQGHPDSRRCPGVEASTGSLGQGLSMAHGMALATRDQRSGVPSRPPRIYALLGDGECQEGQVWEAAMSAAHYRTSNLCVLVDANGLQIDGEVRNIKKVDPLPAKFTAFGWNALEIDGHDILAIVSALQAARTCTDRPTAIIARTIKGKGVSFCENKVEWHGRAPNDEELALAMSELGHEPNNINISSNMETSS